MTMETAIGGDKIGYNTTAMGTRSIPYPGLFFTSSFFIMWLALSILLNRIRHLAPPRRPFLLNQDAAQPFLSKRMQFLLRLPSLFLLLRASTMITALLLASRIDYTTRIESTTYFSVQFIAFAAKLHSWPKLWPLIYPHLLSSYLEQGMTPQSSALMHSLVSAHQIIWDVFIAVSLTTVTETFIRALTDDLPFLASINLLTFAMLLQGFSSPWVNVPLKANEVSTKWILPKPLYLHLLFVLLELFFLHLSFVFTPPLKPMRLYITGFFSLFGQSVQLICIVRAIRSLSSSSSAASSWNALPSVHEAFTAAGAIWISAIMPDAIFECLSVLTISLKILAALLRREEINADLVFGHRAHWPKRTDDWGLAMLTYGEACLASSTLVGLVNEVSPLRICAPVPSSFLSPQLPPLKPSAREEDYDEPSRCVTDSIHPPLSSSFSTVRNRKQKRFGYSNEIKSVKTRRQDGHGIDRTVLGVFDSRRSRYKAYFQFLNLVWRICFYVVYQSYLRGKNFIWNVLDFWGFVEEKDREEGRMEGWKSAGTGDEWEDEMDRDWVPSEDEDDEEDEGSDSSQSQSDDAAKEEEVEASEDGLVEPIDEEEEEGYHEVAGLLHDLIGVKPNRLRRRERTPIASVSSSRAVSPFVPPRSDFEDEDHASLAPVLLAHHLRPSISSPLTRRRYATLTSQAYHQPTAFSSAVASRQQESSLSLTPQQFATRQEAPPSLMQRFCIICTAEERTIICWPCRCLTMCEDCRLSLSEQMAGNQGCQFCVTCRKPIEGFSRIFIP